MPDRSNSLKTLLKRATWLTLPLLLATLLTLHVETDERVSLESVPLKEGKVLGRAFHFIEKNYVDPQVIDPFRMIRRAARELERNIPPLLVKEREKEIDLSMGDKKIVLPISNPLSLSDLVPVLSRLLGFVDLFYQGRLEEQERLSLTLAGVVDTLDPHSNYLSPKVYNEFKIGTKGNFGGLGIVIGIRDSELTVISPLEGTPAFEVGIRAKDKIIQIGEESTINMDLTEAVEKLRGPPGSKVSLLIRRSGTASPLKFNLTRAMIKIQSVGGKLLANKKIGLLKIKNFQEDTLDQFKKRMRAFQEDGASLEGLILDLRNNPGGLLDQAIAMADFFLDQGMIVKTVGATGETIDKEEAREGDPGEHLPIVVIVNEGSASASEIVAGALQLNDRALVIGNRTFGKGSVQTVYDLKDGSALKLTIAKYLTAKDQPVQSIGINPDIGLVPASIDEKTVDLYEDIKKREPDLQEEESEEEKKLPNLPPSPFQITYLSAGKKEDENSGQLELEDDFPVQLAEKILELPESRSLNRQTLLKAIPALLEKMGQGETEKIRASMSKIGIDWALNDSEGEKKGRPVGLIKAEILDQKENPVKGLSPGDSGFLRVSVENHGSAPFFQLSGVTQSDDPLFANLEFPFGRVNPGEKKEWKTTLKIPDFAHRRSEPVTFEFHEAHEHAPKTFTFFMQIEESSPPHFRYSYSILDDGSRGSSGNGNHLPERGETIDLLIKVQNDGKGESTAPMVTLKNLEGGEAFIEKGRDELSKIPAGGSAEGVLRFRIPSKGQQEKLSFDLIIFDNHLGEDLSDRLMVPLNRVPPSPPPGERLSPPIIETSPESLTLVSTHDSYSLKGRVVDDRQIQHLILFVGDEKVFYESAPQGEKTLNFEKTLSLKKGANLITVVAIDDQELASRKQWIVWRTK